MNRPDGKRSVRVGERIRAELMDLVLRGVVRDPKAEGVVVTDVRVTDDLSLARVYIRLLDPDAADESQRRAVRAMRRAAGFVRRELAGRLGLRRVPELEFHWDEVIDNARRIESLMEEIRKEESE